MRTDHRCTSSGGLSLLTLLVALLMAVFFAVLFAGCSSSGSGGKTGGITVSGKVVVFGGQPAGTMVEILGQGMTPLAAATDGSFSFTGVTTPYNLAVYLSDVSAVALYVGLTRPDPSVRAPAAAPLNSVTVSAAVTGGAVLPDPAIDTVYELLVPDTGNLSVSQRAAANGSITNATASWDGPINANLFVHALQWQRIGALGTLPLRYTGYGETTIAVINGGNNTGVSVALGTSSSVPTFQVTGSYTSPPVPPLTPFKTGFFVRSEGDPANPILTETIADTTGTLSFNAPTIPGATVYVRALASSTNLVASALAEVSSTSGAVSLTLPSLLQITSPASGSSIATGTQFAFSEPATSITVLTLASTTGGPHLTLTGAGSPLTLPDLAEIGLGPLPTGSWTATAAAVGPFATMDGGAGPSLLQSVGPTAFDSSILTDAGLTYNAP